MDDYDDEEEEKIRYFEDELISKSETNDDLFLDWNLTIESIKNSIKAKLQSMNKGNADMKSLNPSSSLVSFSSETSSSSSIISSKSSVNLESYKVLPLMSRSFNSPFNVNNSTSTKKKNNQIQLPKIYKPPESYFPLTLLENSPVLKKIGFFFLILISINLQPKHAEEIILPKEEKEAKEVFGYECIYPHDFKIIKEMKLLFISGDKQVFFFYFNYF
jgi:hypothetical protein